MDELEEELMRRYDFLSKDINKNKKELMEYVKKKYKLDLINDRLDIKYIEAYATKRLAAYKWDKVLNQDDPKLKEDSTDFALMKYTLGELKGLLGNPASYYSDIQCMMHFAAVYFASDPINITDRMKVVWDPANDGNKIDKEAANYYYPFSQNIDGMQYSLNKAKGCQKFHELMISDSNLGIFDIKSEIKDYKRYSFFRSHKIYTDLKHTPIENLLLMEFSLGTGYVNKLYGWLRDGKFISYVQQEDMENLFYDSCNISCFVLRSKIMECLWRYLDHVKNKEDCVVKADYIILRVSDAIEEVYSDMLELSWIEFYINLSSDRAYMLELQVRHIWENYFSEEMPYHDALHSVDGEDWREIKRVEDCFAIIPGFPLSEKQLKGVIPFIDNRDYMYCMAKDFYGNNQSFIVESYRNEIGLKITDMVRERIKSSTYPPEILERYKLYYKLRNECFRELKSKNEDNMCGKSLKITPHMKQLKKNHVYAILQRNIIEALLRERIY